MNEFISTYQSAVFLHRQSVTIRTKTFHLMTEYIEPFWEARIYIADRLNESTVE